MNHLESLENESIHIIREAFSQIEPLATLWSIGKDSNVLLYLIRKAFFGRVPFKVIHIDTGKKFPQMYAFRDKYAREWGLELVIRPCPPIEAIDPTLPPAARSAARKTEGLRNVIQEFALKGLFSGIRRDEEATRAKERVFSPRDAVGRWDFKDQPPEMWQYYNTEVPVGGHIRIHPLLHWTELDIWRYTAAKKIPVNDLYFSKNGKRYRSLGDMDITFPIDSQAATLAEIIAELQLTRDPERAGRAMDHEREDSFERLRESGYL